MESRERQKATGALANGEGEAPDSTPQWTLAVVCVATFMLLLDVTVVSIALPTMGASLGADFSGLQWVIDAYTVTLAAFLLTAGSLGDRLGRKKIFNLGLVVFTLASLLAGAAPDILTVNLARSVQGIGGAVMFAVGPALIAQEFLGRERGKAFGLLGGVIGLAIAVGPLVGGAITSGLTWRWIFLLNIPIGLATIAVSSRHLREMPNLSPHRTDWPGMIVFGLALSLIVLGFLRGESLGWTSASILSMLAGGLALLVVFVVLEKRRGAAAMFDLSLFRIPTFAAITTATLFSNAAILAAIYLQIFYMQNVLGYSPWETGLRFLPQTIVLFVVANLTGAIAHKVSPGLLVGSAVALISAGVALAALVDVDTSWTALLPFMIVTGIGMGLFNPPRAAVTVGVTEPAKAGIASGMGETFQQVGVAVGVAAFGAMFHSRVADAFIASDAGQALGAEGEAVAMAVVRDGTRSIGGAVPPELADQVAAAAKASYVNGLDFVMVVCAIVAAVGAVVAFAFIRLRDLHASAIGAPEPLPLVEVEQPASATDHEQ